MHSYPTYNFCFQLLRQKTESTYDTGAVCCNSHVQKNMLSSSNRFTSIQGKTISRLSEFRVSLQNYRVSFWHPKTAQKITASKYMPCNQNTPCDCVAWSFTTETLFQVENWLQFWILPTFIQCLFWSQSTRLRLFCFFIAKNKNDHLENLFVPLVTFYAISSKIHQNARWLWWKYNNILECFSQSLVFTSASTTPAAFTMQPIKHGFNFNIRASFSWWKTRFLKISWSTWHYFADRPSIKYWMFGKCKFITTRKSSWHWFSDRYWLTLPQ